MSDRKLLELAAKAAGIEVWWNGRTCFVLKTKVATHEWNPLTDDGEALRLAVKCGIRDYFGVEIQKTSVQATAFEPWEHCEYEEYKEQGPYAATRRAIVRAAAEIGRSIK